MVVLARRASCDKKTLPRQVIPLAPGYWTALSSRPVIIQCQVTKYHQVSRYSPQIHSRDGGTGIEAMAPCFQGLTATSKIDGSVK